jgi:hypothetical protein
LIFDLGLALNCAPSSLFLYLHAMRYSAQIN